jgi:predicted Rossmann fold nucleotide-binding protein DprA/Smf involved in DNA uptake
MKTIIAGSRYIQDYSLLDKVIKKSGFKITEIISGTAKGVDRLGEKYALDNNIPLSKYPAN